MISEERLLEAIDGAADLDPLVLTDMEARAVAFIQAQTRRYFGPVAETTEYVSGTCSRMLRLAEVVVEVDSDGAIALLEERAYPGGEATVIGEGDFGVRTIYGNQPSEAASMLVRGGGTKWSNGGEYAVTYSRGYAVDEGPKDIEDLILELIRHKLQFADKSGMRSEQIAGYSYTRFGDSDLDAIDGAKDTIAAWRRAVFA